MDPHRLAGRRSLAYHRVIAERLREDPALLDRARERVEAWKRSRPGPYVDAWFEALSQPPRALAELLTSSEEAHVAMRQCTPFAGALSSEERWRIWREVAR